MSKTRVWISSTGTELLGVDVLGTPLVADAEGVEPMTEITGAVSVTIDAEETP